MPYQEELRQATHRSSAPETKKEELPQQQQAEESLTYGIQEYQPVQLAILADARAGQCDEEAAEQAPLPPLQNEADVVKGQEPETSQREDVQYEASQPESSRDKEGSGKGKDTAPQELVIPFNRRPPFVSGPFKERVKDPKVKLVTVSGSDAKGSGMSPNDTVLLKFVLSDALCDSLL